MIATPPAKKISKEQLRAATLHNAEGYFKDCDIRDKNHKLHLSILLVNHAESTVKIVFNTMDGYKEMLGAIWGATEKYILLKGGSFIPVGAVAYVAVNDF